MADNHIAELISASDGFQYTLRIMDEYAKEAKQGLDVFKDSTARQKLLELVESVRLNIVMTCLTGCGTDLIRGIIKEYEDNKDGIISEFRELKDGMLNEFNDWIDSITQYTLVVSSDL